MSLIATTVLSSLLWVGFQTGPAIQRIVSASNVRLRSQPQMNAEVLSNLSFGTVLTQTEVSADREWYRVLAPGGKSGWVFANLTQPFSERDSTAAYRRIIQSRLAVESLSFSEASDLFRFVDRIAPQVQNSARAEFELFRLNALARAVHQINRYEPTDSEQRNWIEKYMGDLAYSEPAGEWLVKADLYWELEARYRGNPIADEIAWNAANTGIPGECEGYLPCHFAILLITDGRYIDLHPGGSHLAEAFDRIDDLLQEVVRPNTPYFMDPRAAKELRESIESLARILGRSSDARKSAILERLHQVEQNFAASPH